MNSITFPHVVGTAVTTAILFCGVSASGQFSNFPALSSERHINSEGHDYGLTYDRYQLLSEGNIQKNNITIIHSFASDLLENIEDMPAEFSEVVDENFWDLI